ncbi:MarR family transcriptional regulator [Streptomyces sp. SID13031]|nr:MarR family transcriptional regulator [Streptomyces sp. SID13031]
MLTLHGPQRPGELAERSSLTSGGGITDALDRLEKADMITRSRDTADRREVLVTANTEYLRNCSGRFTVDGPAILRRWTTTSYVSPPLCSAQRPTSTRPRPNASASRPEQSPARGPTTAAQGDGRPRG